MKIVQHGHHGNPHEQSYELVPGLLEGIGPQVLSGHSPQTLSSPIPDEGMRNLLMG